MIINFKQQQQQQQISFSSNGIISRSKQTFVTTTTTMLNFKSMFGIDITFAVWVIASNLLGIANTNSTMEFVQWRSNHHRTDNVFWDKPRVERIWRIWWEFVEAFEKRTTDTRTNENGLLFTATCSLRQLLVKLTVHWAGFHVELRYILPL